MSTAFKTEHVRLIDSRSPENPFIPPSTVIGFGCTPDRFVANSDPYASLEDALKESGYPGATIRHIEAIEKPGDTAAATIIAQWDITKDRWIHPFEDGIVLSLGQWEVFKSVMDGNNVFLTGLGGCGKSALVLALKERCAALKKAFIVTASTGISALNVKGITLHSFMGMGLTATIADYWGQTFDHADLRRALLKEPIIVMEELSMIKGEHLEMINFAFKNILNSDEPFGGVQILGCGDFLQLPPVYKRGDTYEYKYAFQAPAWEKANFDVHVLRESFRTSDQQLVDFQARIRVGDASPDVIEYFSGCVGRKLDNPTTLCSTNREASRINQYELQRLNPGADIYRYKAKVEGKDYHRKKFASDCIAEETLELKVGAPVILLVNDRQSGFVNGDRGIITAMDSPIGRGHLASPPTITVKLSRNGREIEINKNRWSLMRQNHRNGQLEEAAAMVQYPLKLAWAITIHKSQGMSLDSVYIDVNNVFENHQGYVALSRVRTYEGLTLQSPIRPGKIKVDPACLEFYQKADRNDRHKHSSS